LLSRDFLAGGSISTMMGIKEREFRPLPDNFGEFTFHALG
jgi:hypothetical protein